MDGKKISFGIKSTTKLNIIGPPKLLKKNDDRELIDFVEGAKIKIAGKKEEKPPPLVIPLKEDKNATKLRASMALKIIKEEQGLEPAEPEAAEITAAPTPLVKIENETLEEKAAREILATLKATTTETDETKVFTLPLKADELTLDGAKESSIDDYDNIPIQDYGLAMLRGMGWKDENKKKPDDKFTVPVVRPKGMGLGADKAAKPKALLIQPAHNEVLELKMGACVKVVAGKYQDLYGQIEGFDDDSGRVFIKLTIGGAKESLNEFMIQVVTKEEWTKYGKVLNSAKYEEYKNKDLERNQENNYKNQDNKDSSPLRPSLPSNQSASRERKRSHSSSPEYKSKNYRAASPAHSESRDRQRNYSPKYQKEQRRRSPSPDDRQKSVKKTERRRSQSREDSRTHRERRRSPPSKSSSSKKMKDKKRSSSLSSTSSIESVKKHHKKSKSKKSHKKSRHHSSSEGNSDDDKRHKKKTKKSKKPRSRSRTRK